MRPTDVLAKIEDQYSTYWQYYQVFAEALIEENALENLHDVFRKCVTNCGLKEDEVRQRFGLVLIQHAYNGICCVF